MTERVKGLSLEDAGKIKNTEIAKELALPPVKLHCSSAYMHLSPLFTLLIPSLVLAEDAIRSAIKDYRSKRAKLAESKPTSFINVAQTTSTADATAAAHSSQT
jgi:NifU-like protein involved in Fe-S cluster formation